MAIQASGRATFTKVIDGVSGVFTLTPTYGTQVISKDPKSWAPDFGARPNMITPSLKILGIGDTDNQIKGKCTWKINGAAINGTTEVSLDSAGGYALKIAHNFSSAVLIECSYTWTHPATKQQVTFSASLPVPVVENAGTMIMALIMPLSTDRFQTTAGAAQTLSFDGAMIRGGAEDKTGVSYKWQIWGPKSGKFADIPDNGTLTDASCGLPTGVKLFTFGANRKTITVDSRAVVNVGSLKLIVTDTDPNSTTSGKTAEYVKGLIDDTDPIDLEMVQLDGGSITAGGPGNRMCLAISQGNKDWSDDDYVGKTLAFYRETAAHAKDATFAPPASEFPGWSVDGTNHVVKRTFTTDAKGTADNRTVTIKYGHLLADSVQTSFSGYVDY